jgi:TPR repeat protein
MNGPPITKASVDEYRSRIKADPDPEAQFNFCKYLIEAAKKISSSASGDERSAKKYRDALLAESLKGIKRLATQGVGLGKPAYADAQFFLANCLGNGSLGLQVDHEKAYNLYVQASKQNHSSATYRTAVCNEVGAGTRRDHARAVLFYRKASALGDTAGMYKLGMILLNGLLGQQRNPKEAFAWLKRAASQADEDNPHALHELGLLYEKAPPPNAPGSLSSIVPYDPAQARDLFTQAGQLGYPPSQFKLGTCYEYGSLTCPVDPRRSIAWYTRAAERADAESELALSGWYLTGSDGVLKQSDSEAYLWARRAANKGLPKAEYAVGYYSEVGIGVKQDLEEAKRWYMRAAGTSPPLLSLAIVLTKRWMIAQGNKRAMQRLTELKKQAEKGRAAMTSGKKARPTRKDAESECVIS